MSKRQRRNNQEKKRRQAFWNVNSIDPSTLKDLTGYKNLYGKPDHTPAEADRLRIYDLSILTE
jgi:hypothetical protein